SKCGLGYAIIMIAIMTVVRSIFMLPVDGHHRECAGKISAENGEEKEFALRLDVRARGKIIPQMALGQEVGKKRRQAGGNGTCWRDKSAFLSLERKAQGWSVGIVNVGLLERKKMAVPAQAVDDADLAAMQLHGKRVQGFGIKFHHGACPSVRVLHRPWHRAGVLRTRPAPSGRG